MFGKNGEGYFSTFAKVDKLYKKMCFQAVSEYQFTPNEIVVLMFLSNNPALDTAKDIAYFRNISKGLVAKSVESLCRKGFLSQQKDPKDRRLIHLKLTEKSQDITARLQACKKLFFAQLVTGIPGEDLEKLKQMTEKINDNLEQILQKEHQQLNHDDQQETTGGETL